MVVPPVSVLTLQIVGRVRGIVPHTGPSSRPDLRMNNRKTRVLMGEWCSGIVYVERLAAMDVTPNQGKHWVRYRLRCNVLGQEQPVTGHRGN